jgi:hypothetical protein
MSTGGSLQRRRKRSAGAFALAVAACLLALFAAPAASEGATANLVSNPSFESGVDGWYGYDLSTLSRNTSWAAAGSASLRVSGAVASSAGDYVVVGTDAMPVRPGISYTASAQVDVNAVPAGEATYLQIFWLDANGQPLTNATTSAAGLGGDALTLEARAPTSAYGAQVRIFSYSKLGERWTTYVDDVHLAPTPLDWKRPSLVSPTTVTLGTGFTETDLDPNQDYIVKLPSTTKVGGTVLVGGHNVVIVGGSITIPKGTESDFERSAIYVKEATGTVHIEGVLIDGSGGGEFDGVAINAPEAIVQLQNMRIVGVRGGYDSVHADVVQPWGGVKDLRIDRLSGASNYQGLTIKPDLGPIGSTEIYETDLTATTQGTVDRGGHMLWLTSGVDTCSTGATTLSEVFVQPRPGKTLNSAVWPQHNLLSCPAVGTTSIGWPALPVTGAVQKGSPPEGSFVPAGVAGTAYHSPGYLGG